MQARFYYEGADILLAPSAGNSIRRSVSTNSTVFVMSSHHTAPNPTTVQGNRIDAWRGSAAINYGLRGPLFVFDNAFTNGTSTVQPHHFQDDCELHGACHLPMVYMPWVSYTGLVVLAANTIDGYLLLL